MNKTEKSIRTKPIQLISYKIIFNYG